MSKEAMLLRSDLWQSWSLLIEVSRVWSLFRRLSYSNVYFCLLSHCDNFSCLRQIEGNVQRASNIVGCTEREYSQRKTTLYNMIDDPSYQPIPTCGYHHIYAIFFPKLALSRQSI